MQQQQQDHLELQSGGAGGGAGAGAGAAGVGVSHVLHRHLDQEHPRHYPPTPNVIIETTDISGDTVATAIDGEEAPPSDPAEGGGTERLLGICPYC